MAKRTVCDYPIRGEICGEHVDRITTLNVDGKTYELEICETHRKPLYDIIEKVRPKKIPAQKAKSNGKGPTDKAVREWAAAQGMEVKSFGRLPQSLREQYQAAH